MVAFVSAFVFPGQGSQKIGMGRDFYDQYQIARHVFEEVDDALNDKLSAIILGEDQEKLNLTAHAQPALMTISIAILRVIMAQTGANINDLCQYVAGHSLGEYSAITAAGGFSLSDCAKLLRFRGEAMQRAVPVGEGAMAAIIGMEFETLDNIVKQISEKNNAVVTIANDNSDGQIVISGAKTAVDDAIIAIKDAGAKRALLLPVSAPFHCPLMQSAADEMKQMLSEITCHDLPIPLFTNVMAQSETSGDKIKEYLYKQICAQVRWREIMINMGEQTQHFYEIGAGKVLSTLLKRQLNEVTVGNIETTDDLKKYCDEREA